MLLINWLNSFFSFSYYDIVYLVESYQFFLATVLFSLKQKKRKYTPLYLVLAGLCFIGFSFLLGYLRSLFVDNIIYQMMSKLFLYCECLLAFFFCYSDKKIVSLLNWVTGLSARELVDAIATLIVIASGSNPRSSLMNVSTNAYVNCLVFDIIHIGLLVALYFVFRNRLLVNSDRSTNFKIVLLFIFVLLALVVCKSFIIKYANESSMLFLTSECLILILSTLLLFIRTDILQESNYKTEMKIMNQVLGTEQNQYESLKENIASINMKAHDIKHQLENYQDKLTSEEVGELKKSVAAYDKRIDTGSQVLDTVLYSVQLNCDKENITLSCLADGKVLEGFADSQIYYLFNNILGNAVEAVKKVEEPDKRLVSLHIYQKENYVYIEESNYFKGTVVLNGNQIESSKADQQNHGFGLKSIAFLVTQNKGQESIRTEDDMFFLVIKLPLPASGKKASL